MLEKWTKILDNQGSIDCVYLDFMKAFHTVPHQRLIYKLRYYGILTTLVNWISSFLSKRRQRVRVADSFSEWAPITSGMPQGSVLGPILFVLYVNDLPDNLKSECYMFADDTKVLKNLSSKEDNLVLQKDILELENWSKRWLLRFHPEKCKVLAIGKHQSPKFTYTLCDTELVYT